MLFGKEKNIVENIIVTKNDMRIDKYLAEVTNYSRSQIEKMIEQNCIMINDNLAKRSTKVKIDDVIKWIKEYHFTTEMIPEKMNLNIVYEDDDIMVIDKPSGLVVHPGSGNHSGTLANGLLFYTKNLSDENGEQRPGIVHRIDKDTSGLLLIAKNNTAHQILVEEFKDKQVSREYIALLTGEFKNKNAIIDCPIGRDEQNRKRMTVTAKNSKQAITHLTVLKRYEGYTLVRLKLETGRTHQIRVHMKYIGYPIYNDPVYTNKNCTKFGQFLHADKIHFVHPITKEKMCFTSEIPKEITEFLNTLNELKE